MKKYLLMFLVVLVCISCQSTEDGNKATQVAVQTPNINFREHVIVKGGDDKHVVYEYSDVRIDDVASLAIEYCHRKNSEYQASLRDIYMYKNHKRRATFNCERIAQR